jgi:hypothetical protein
MPVIKKKFVIKHQPETKKLAKIDKSAPKKKPPPVKKPDNVDLQSLGQPNINTSAWLPEDFKKGSTLVQSDVYPEDPLDTYTVADLDPSKPGGEYWNLLRKVETKFPLLRLRTPLQPEGATMAFVDERYGCSHTPIGGIAPPTWMDPDIFLRMLLKDTKTQELVKAAVDRNSFKPLKELEAQIQLVFEAEYLPYLLEKLAGVQNLLGRWIIAHGVLTSSDKDYRPGPEHPPKKKKAP